MQLRIMHHEWIVGIQVITIIHTQVFVMSLCTDSNELMLVDRCNGCLYVCVCVCNRWSAGRPECSRETVLLVVVNTVYMVADMRKLLL